MNLFTSLVLIVLAVSALAAEVYLVDNLGAYIFMNCLVSADANSTIASLVFYGQNHISEALATYDLATGDIKLTQSPESTVRELNNLGLFPRADIDYWQMLNSMASEPKKTERRSNLMTNEEAQKMARDDRVMRISQYLDVIAKDKSAGIRKVIGTNAWPGETVKIEKTGSIKQKRWTDDCCDRQDCTGRNDCNSFSKQGQKCVCLVSRLSSNCDWLTVLVFTTIGAQQVWHCSN